MSHELPLTHPFTVINNTLINNLFLVSNLTQIMIKNFEEGVLKIWCKLSIYITLGMTKLNLINSLHFITTSCYTAYKQWHINDIYLVT